MKMAELAGIKYQQVGKYELGVDQMSAYRLMQFANILKVKIKYLFDPEYINKMKGYHQDRVFHAAMPPEMMDIDQLQANAAEAMMLLKSRHIYNDMAKILKIQTGTVDVVVTQEFDDEDTAMAGTEVNKTDVKIAEFKVENIKWKKGEIKNE